MGFDFGAGSLPGAAARVRRRLERAAIGIEQAMAALPALASLSALNQDAALAADLALARADLRRACSLGQQHGGAARCAALALLALVCEREFAVAPSRQQLMGALAMHEGHAAELGFGPGKALAVALTAILHVWSGRQCHIVGASDYLVARDAAALGSLYKICGCSVASLASTTAPTEMAQCYGADVLYATGRQLLSDFMRDHLLLSGAVSPLRRSLRAQHMAPDAPQPVTRGTSVAIIDDIEAVLADEAASPVLISAAGNHSVLDGATQAALAVIGELQAERDYQLERQPLLQVHFTPQGEDKLAHLALRLPVYWQHPSRASDLLSLALLARDGLACDRHYVVREGKVIVTDDSVYRLLAGRSWQFGMLQAIEARHGLPCSAPPRTIARAVFQTFFPRYHRLAGAGGACDGLGAELLAIYRLPVARLAIAAPRAQARLFDQQGEKLDALVDTVEQLHRQRLPVLVGVPRSADMAAIGRMLLERGIAFVVADGRDETADAQLLRCAAQPVTGQEGIAPSESGHDVPSDFGRITLLVGAAGRGASVDPGASALHVLLFEHWDTRRGDLAFFSLGAHALIFTSADDDLLIRHLPARAAWLRRLARFPLLRRHTFQLMVALAQRQVVRQSSRHRQAMVQREIQLDSQLAFSKKG